MQATGYRPIIMRVYDHMHIGKGTSVGNLTR